MTFTDAAVDVLCRYRWPGNVRELQNCIERAVILADEEVIQAHHLNLSFAEPLAQRPSSPWEEIDLSGTLNEASRRIIGEVERRKITEALGEAGGNRGRAAELLQISFKALTTKMRELRLE